MRIVQTHAPGAAVGRDAGEPLPGLRGDATRRRGGHQLLQVVDGTDEAAVKPPRTGVVLSARRALGGSGLRAAHRTFGVGQQPLRVARRTLDRPTVHRYQPTRPAVAESPPAAPTPQRRLITYSTEHDGLDPFSPKGPKPSSLLSTVHPRINSPTFSGRST
jgi:hypothetical protein